MKSSEPNIQIDISSDFTKAYPGSAVGILVLENVEIQNKDSGFDAAKRKIILGLKKQFPDLNSLKAQPVIQAYSKYYKKYDKSYHVLGQLRSVIFEDRPLPSVSPLIEAIFTSELKNMLLTAFHDLEKMIFPLLIGISSGEETNISLSGDEKRLKPADMMVSDQTGVISSVIYGPDKRTCVTPSTSKILIVVYAPDGIRRESIINHFLDIESLIQMISPECKRTLHLVFPLC